MVLKFQINFDKITKVFVVSNQREMNSLLSFATWTARCMSTAMLSGTNEEEGGTVEVEGVTTDPSTPSRLRRLSSRRDFNLEGEEKVNIIYLFLTNQLCCKNTWSAKVIEETWLDGRHPLLSLGEVRSLAGLEFEIENESGERISDGKDWMNLGGGWEDIWLSTGFLETPASEFIWIWLPGLDISFLKFEITYPLSLSGVASLESSRLSSG